LGDGSITSLELITNAYLVMRHLTQALCTCVACPSTARLHAFGDPIHIHTAVRPESAARVFFSIKIHDWPLV
jgi:hypothetical protein